MANRYTHETTSSHTMGQGNSQTVHTATLLDGHQRSRWGQRHACGNTCYNAVASESQAGKCSSSGDLGHPYNGKILDLLDLESLNNCQEARDAFPQEVFDTAGYPVVCWRFGIPIGLRTINEKNTISKSKQLMGFQCQCHKVSDKYKDHSGHVVTSATSYLLLCSV